VRSENGKAFGHEDEIEDENGKSFSVSYECP
jgi:hypothetical protein